MHGFASQRMRWCVVVGLLGGDAPIGVDPGVSRRMLRIEVGPVEVTVSKRSGSVRLSAATSLKSAILASPSRY